MGIFSSPPSKSKLQNASSTAPFFHSDSAGKDLWSVWEEHCLLYQLLGKRLQKQPCNYPGAFLSLPPESKASSFLLQPRAKPVVTPAGVRPRQVFGPRHVCCGYFAVVLTYSFYSSCLLGNKRKGKGADLPVRSLPDRDVMLLGWRSLRGGGYWFNHGHQLRGSHCWVLLTGHAHPQPCPSPLKSHSRDLHLHVWPIT